MSGGNKFIIAVIAMSFLAGCDSALKSQSSSAPQAGEAKGYSTFNVNKYALNKLVCDPWGGEPPTDFEQGLKAKLWYLRPGDPRIESVAGIIQNGVASSQNLFFTQVNVPTRIFSLGFPTQTGTMVKTDEGVDLVEYFALRFEGGLRLAPDDEEGTYELALLSDDGANMYVSSGEGELRRVVNNDGLHPSRFGCGDTIDMQRNSQLKLQLDYYQGPRYHISLIPMWRKVNGTRQAEPLCGATGNGTFFDYNNNSEPQQAYKDLLARGWKPIRAENYKIPANAGFNPCVEGEAPVISNFQVDTGSGEAMIVTWNTNIPATSQVRYVNVNSGVETLTTSDNVLRTSHRIEVRPGLREQIWDVQGISISADFGKALSQIEQVVF